jgi:glycosyltransferase involved in cell wall biosynthesis
MTSNKGFNLAGKKLMIGLPAYDYKVTVSMAVSLMKLSQMVLQHGIDIQVNSICGCSVVSRARNVIAKQFLESDCDHLMFIDADMTFDPESVIRLMAWNQERGIVAGAYVARKEAKTYILSIDGGNGINGTHGKITMDEDGLVRAYRVATGFMMIQKQVFTKLAEQHPEWKHMDTNSPQMLYSFFDFLVTPEGMIGEDFLFCDRAREAGFEVWIDPTIKLGHMGVVEHKSDFGNDVLYPSMISQQTMSDAA